MSAPAIRHSSFVIRHSALRTPHSALRTSTGGFVLLFVLVVVMLGSMVAVSLLFALKAEGTASAAGLHNEQAWTAALSGVSQAMQIAAAATPESLDWQDNPAVFRDQLVFADGAYQWYFTIFSPGEADALEPRYGLTDEASKLNLNQADEAMLEAFPNLGTSLAQALRDYRNPAAPIQTGGAGRGANPDIMVNPTPALPNVKLTFLDELLMAPGINARLLYGEDANRNGRLDPNEDDGDALWPVDNQDGQLDLGWQTLLTVCSYDSNTDHQGQPRLNLNNTTNLAGLELPETVATYLADLRRNQQSLSHPVQLLEASGKFKDEKGVEVEMQSGISQAELPVLLDRCTATNQTRLPGLINLNTAAASVLATLPDIDQIKAEAIVAARISLSPEARQTIAWLYQEGLVNADQFKKIAPYVTTRGYQYHFHVLGYAVPEGPYRHLEVIIDTAVQPPVILLLRDLTRFGVPLQIAKPEEQAGQNEI